MPTDDSYTKVLLHMDGADNSTTFTDESGKTWTANGNALIDEDVSKFGGASGLFDGTDDYVTTGNSADLDMGTGDWTVDFWYRRNGNQAGNSGLVCPQDNVAGWGIQFGVTGIVGTTNAPMLLTRAGGGSTLRLASPTALTNTTWTHIAVVVSSGTATIYQDGTSVASGSVSGVNFNSNGTGAVIGRRVLDVSEGADINGWMDELRVSKGIARWTSNFTPPTSAYISAVGGNFFWFM